MQNSPPKKMVSINTTQNMVKNRVEIANKTRSSNLELYRIVCMIMIVAHHYVVNSGFTSEGGALTIDFSSRNSIFLSLFGAWGKTGINCFLMITGYFMCTSQITMRKFIKLLGQVYLYRWLLYILLLWGGYETLSIRRVAMILMPTWGFTDNFTGCFIFFWLTIPFINILVHNMTKRQHEILTMLSLCIYTFLGSIPTFSVTFNYISWFSIIYLIASYIRIYPHPMFDRKRLWGWLTLLNITLAVVSIVIARILLRAQLSSAYFFISDSNKILSVLIAVCSFIWFKNINIQYSKIINSFGAGTFGVLLIHANSDAMRNWLWKKTIDVVNHYTLPLGYLAIYSIGVVLAVFIICNIIDQRRIVTLEKMFLNCYDHWFAEKVNKLVDKVINSNS